MNRDDLHPYQERAVEWVLGHPSSALWLAMGLGKTAATLTAIADLHADFGFDRVLVIAPKRVARSVWPREIAKWEHTKHLDYAVAVGTAKQRLAAVAQRATITVINRENVKWLVEQFAPKQWPYDFVVIDESDSFKDRSSGRFRALKSVRLQIRRMVQLTGTPTPKSLIDLWAQCFLLDGGVRLGRTLTAYRERWFVSDYMGYAWSPRSTAPKQIQEALADIVISMSAEDHIQMPDRIDNFVFVDLPEVARRQYRELEKDFLLALGDETVVAANEAVLTGKLLQAANGALYHPVTGEYTVIHDEKLDALEEIVEGALGRPVLVAYSLRSDAERILRKFKSAVVLDDRLETEDRWNRGEIPILLAHPASCGHGLNLQAGGSLLVWFGLNWGLGLYEQMNARLHRQGQREAVVVHHIVAKDTIDDTVLAALAAKGDTQRSLLAALKADIKRRV